MYSSKSNNWQTNRACPRAAGESDEDEDDYDGFSFGYDEPKPQKQYHFKTSQLEQTIQTESTFSFVPKNETPVKDHKKTKEFEDSVIKACMNGQTELVKEYLNDGNDPNKLMYSDWTLLLFASSSIEPEVMQLLLEKGANSNLQKDGCTPLIALCSSIKVETSAENSLKCLKSLLDANANVEFTNKQRETGLMLACKYREQAFVEELIKHYKDVNAYDSEDQTALFYAVLGKKPEIVKLLLQKGAISNQKNRRSMTPYDIAKHKAYEEIEALLATDNVNDFVFCEAQRINGWEDLFPGLRSNNENKKKINQDVSALLYGMNLEKYQPNFCGMELKTFLRLSQQDLINMDIDISVHRKMFLENIFKFHNKKWSQKSLGPINNKGPYTILKGVWSLGNISKHIQIIGSSFHFVKQSIQIYKLNGVEYTYEQEMVFKQELKKTEKTIEVLKEQLHKINAMALQIQEETKNSLPATYIGKKQESCSKKRVVFAIGGFTIAVGLSGFIAAKKLNIY